MGAAQRGAEGHAVAFCQEVFNRELKIGEGSVKFVCAVFGPPLVSGAAVAET